jgi:hypothetical protein
MGNLIKMDRLRFGKLLQGERESLSILASIGQRPAL